MSARPCEAVRKRAGLLARAAGGGGGGGGLDGCNNGSAFGSGGLHQFHRVGPSGGSAGGGLKLETHNELSHSPGGSGSLATLDGLLEAGPSSATLLTLFQLYCHASLHSCGFVPPSHSQVLPT